MIFHGGAGIVLHLVGIIDQDQATALISLIVTQNIHQFVPGTVQIDLRQLPQFRPGKNNVITVHQKVFLRFFLRYDLPHTGVTGTSRQAARIVATVSGRSMVSAESVGILRLFPISLAEDLFDLFLRNNPLYTTPGLTNSALLPVYCLQSRIRNAVRTFDSFLLRLPAALHMGIFWHLVPGHLKTGTMSAEHRSGGVDHIRFRIIADLCHYLLRIMAGFISLQCAGQTPMTFGIRCHLFSIISHRSHGNTSRQHTVIAFCLRCFKASVHPRDIRHGSAKILRRHLQSEGKPWF